MIGSLQACVAGSSWSHRHSLLLSSAQDVHPVLDRVPGRLPVQDVAQLHVVQVLFQHLHTHTHTHTQ